MAASDQNLLGVIHRMCEALTDSECSRLFYLCDTLGSDKNGTCVKEMLLTKVMSCDSGPLLLAELLLHLKRYDILRRVFGASRGEMENTLGSRQLLPRFRVLMVNISENLDNEDLGSMKFLLQTMLPRERLEKTQTFLDVITELEKLDKVSSERVDFVEECLRHVGRVDLAQKVHEYKIPGAVASEQSHMVTTRRLVHSRHIGNAPVSVHRQLSSQGALGRYQLHTDPRGVCVIVDCVGHDGEMLKHTFKSLHFDVVLHKRLGVEETFSTLRDTFRGRENREGDCFVCCIISRGSSSHLLATESDSNGLHLDKVRRLFTADACAALVGKPKLFFIQRYSVPQLQLGARMEHQDEHLETDARGGVSSCGFIPEDADLLWSHCWTDERQLQLRHHRSVYLNALTEALHSGQRRKEHLVDVHVKVNGAIFEHNGRSPGEEYHIELKHTLRKDLYL